MREHGGTFESLDFHAKLVSVLIEAFYYLKCINFYNNIIGDGLSGYMLLEELDNKV